MAKGLSFISVMIFALILFLAVAIFQMTYSVAKWLGATMSIDINIAKASAKKEVAFSVLSFEPVYKLAFSTPDTVYTDFVRYTTVEPASWFFRTTAYDLIVSNRYIYNPITMKSAGAQIGALFFGGPVLGALATLYTNGPSFISVWVDMLRGSYHGTGGEVLHSVLGMSPTIYYYDKEPVKLEIKEQKKCGKFANDITLHGSIETLYIGRWLKTCDDPKLLECSKCSETCVSKSIAGGYLCYKKEYAGFPEHPYPIISGKEMYILDLG